MSTTTTTPLSFYIPHVFSNLSKEIVTQTFEEQIGKVNYIDFVSHFGQDGRSYNSAYVHMDCIHDTIFANNFVARVVDTNIEARLVYDEPWYWIVLENKSSKHISGNRKPRIDIGDLSTHSAKKTVTQQPNMSAYPKSATSYAAVLGVTKTEKPREVTKISNPTSYARAASAYATQKLPEKQQKPETEVESEVEVETNEIYDEMSECEYAMIELDEDLISIDRRYIETIEKENAELHNMIYQLNWQIQQLTDANNAESIKSRAFAEAIQMLASNK